MSDQEGSEKVDLPLSDEEGNEISCYTKDFSSMKSLFGHMRNHLERGWRGIRPSPSVKNNCYSNVYINHLLVFFCFFKNMKKEFVSNEISNLTPTKPNKFFLKLKFSKTLKRCGQHIYPSTFEAKNKNKTIYISTIAKHFQSVRIDRP